MIAVETVQKLSDARDQMRLHDYFNLLSSISRVQSSGPIPAQDASRNACI